jgi:Na+-driven multidrug efflux pump
MSGAAAAGNIEGFLYIALNAFYHASLTFVGQNVGAKKFENIKKIIGCSVASVVVIGVVLQAFALIFARQLIGLYAEGDEAIHQGVVKMFIMMSTYFLCGIMEVFSGGLRGMGRSFTSMFISLSGACLFRIIWLETIFKWVNTPTSIYLSYPISWTLTSLCSMIFLILAVKKESKKLEKL